MPANHFGLSTSPNAKESNTAIPRSYQGVRLQQESRPDIVAATFRNRLLLGSLGNFRKSALWRLTKHWHGPPWPSKLRSRSRRILVFRTLPLYQQYRTRILDINFRCSLLISLLCIMVVTRVILFLFWGPTVFGGPAKPGRTMGARRPPCAWSHASCCVTSGFSCPSNVCLLRSLWRLLDGNYLRYLKGSWGCWFAVEAITLKYDCPPTPKPREEGTPA